MVSLGHENKLRIDRCKRRGLPYVKFGKSVRYALTDIQNYMDNHTGLSTDFERFCLDVPFTILGQVQCISKNVLHVGWHFSQILV